jgi:acetylornithine deacetylase/succinyl-diaminopimelate desuccinylase-like protein
MPLYELSGGSIGVAASIKNILDIDCILMGYGLPDDGLHSLNEKLSLTMFGEGIKTNIEFLTRLESI